MDGHRVAGRSQRTGHTAISDAALDREIESLLTVEPSPEFLARVRGRVAEGPGPVGWRVPWVIASATAVAAVVIGLIVWPSRDVTPVNNTPVEPPRIADAGPANAPAPEVVSEPVRDLPVGFESPRESGTPSARRATDVVAAHDLVPIVNEDDGKAFDALLATIRDRRVVLTFSESPDSALTASSLAIDPIAIDPLPDVLDGGVE
jgi:hypothetical protein